MYEGEMNQLIKTIQENEDKFETEKKALQTQSK